MRFRRNLAEIFKRTPTCTKVMLIQTCSDTWKLETFFFWMYGISFLRTLASWMTFSRISFPYLPIYIFCTASFDELWSGQAAHFPTNIANKYKDKLPKVDNLKLLFSPIIPNLDVVLPFPSHVQQNLSFVFGWSMKMKMLM